LNRSPRLFSPREPDRDELDRRPLSKIFPNPPSPSELERLPLKLRELERPLLCPRLIDRLGELDRTARMLVRPR
jgi:hypothetical protein